MATAYTIHAALHIESVLRNNRSWMNWEQIKAKGLWEHLSKAQCFKAMKFLQENKMVVSRFTDSGTKEYRTRTSIGFIPLRREHSLV